MTREARFYITVVVMNVIVALVLRPMHINWDAIPVIVQWLAGMGIGTIIVVPAILVSKE